MLNPEDDFFGPDQDPGTNGPEADPAALSAVYQNIQKLVFRGDAPWQAEAKQKFPQGPRDSDQPPLLVETRTAPTIDLPEQSGASLRSVLDPQTAQLLELQDDDKVGIEFNQASRPNVKDAPAEPVPAGATVKITKISDVFGPYYERFSISLDPDDPEYHGGIHHVSSEPDQVPEHDVQSKGLDLNTYTPGGLLVRAVVAGYEPGSDRAVTETERKSLPETHEWEGAQILTEKSVPIGPDQLVAIDELVAAYDLQASAEPHAA